MKNLQPLIGRGRLRLLFKLFAAFKPSMLLLLITILQARTDVHAQSSIKQPIRITGTVAGDNNEPLAGVSIQVKGSTTGTSTNNKGEYSLTAGDKDTLLFSYVGYSDKEVPVNGQN